MTLYPIIFIVVFFHSPHPVCSPLQVEALLEKVRYMKKVEPSLPNLDWDSAVMALSRNGMDVDATCYAIQSDWLQPLYEYIYSEYTAVAKTDMEEIKKIIKNDQQYSLEVNMGGGGGLKWPIFIPPPPLILLPWWKLLFDLTKATHLWNCVSLNYKQFNVQGLCVCVGGTQKRSSLA